MKSLMYIVIPLIGAVTGWLITTLTLKSLFWPKKPTGVLGLGFTIQGLIPKKQEELAAGVGELIEAQLRCAVSGEAGLAPGVLTTVTGAVVATVRERLNHRIPAFIPGGIKAKTIKVVEDIVRKEIPAAVETLADNLNENRCGGPDFGRWAGEKILDYDVVELERKISGSREAKYLKITASVIGFVAGVFQLIAVVLMNS